MTVMLSYRRGLHYPEPVPDGERFACGICGRRLNRYTDEYGKTRLRHYWRDRGRA